jgi:hypothetical protein
MLTNIAMTVLSRLAASFVRAMTAAILVTVVAVLLPTCEAEAQTTIRMNPSHRLDKGESIAVEGKASSPCSRMATSSCTTPPTSRDGQRARTARPSPTSSCNPTVIW